MLKLGRQYFLEKGEGTRTRFIARRQGYHGNTLGALGTGGNLWRREPFAPLMVETSHIAPGYAYRGRHADETPKGYGRRVDDELEAELQRLGPDSVIGFVGLAAFTDVAPGNLSIEALGLMPDWAAVVFLLVALIVLGSSVDSYLTAIASLTSRDIYYRHLNTDATDAQQLRVARAASIGFAVVIFAGTVFALGSVSFVQLLLIGGIGASALVGPFALSLFWTKASETGFVSGVVVSQLVTAYLNGV